MTARLITVNDVYASDPHIVIDIDDFEDVIGSISGSRRDRLKEIPVHIVHGRYDRVCHLYQAEALVRALRAVGNNEVNYFITMAGHSSLEPETDSKLCTIMNDLPPVSLFDRGGK